ncbi:aromatic compound dioxygenase [Fomitiporia mediterranea MF3/22]|uniref:aromatic compound dioxygenase n=1 Tax=Fomitiporia mediterranea (strain MF3/22) TaxID=694068 RepID=UPI000440737A|nr:aromatic compound dioxygenase [Fomitiporia mediterranea MF3/22]EJD00727.1 aromatic compound dioxygenase [Fomitiporia mediterranea MF3/22]
MHCILKSTCVTAPEIEEGPYYVNNELVRQDLVEDQKGVLLRLDIGVIDTASCESVPDALVEIWSANATGFYGAFEANTLGGPTMSSNATWLRGGFPTDDSGTVELTTIYPGFYSGRTIHVHLMVHTDWEQSSNGTLISHAGSLKHIGQLFFDESWNDQVLSLEPYTENRGRRTLNSQDHDFARANVDGSSAIVELELLADSIEKGLLGFITIGIDLSADYSIHSGNYYNSTTDLDAPFQNADVSI